MGRVIKNDKPVLPVTEPPSFQRVIKAGPRPQPSAEPPAPKEAVLFRAPRGKVIPASEYKTSLGRAEGFVQQKRYAEALPDLLNLEVSSFGDLRPHELLAEIYLELGQIELAKEQCVHCADILAKENPDSLVPVQTFEQLIQSAGSPADAEQNYRSFMSSTLDESNFFEGSKSALHLAAHRMNENRYQEAEALLTAYRDRCLALFPESI